MTVRYRTIVADPPWEDTAYVRPGWSWREGCESGEQRELDYPTMALDDIKSLPVQTLCEGDKWHVNGARGGSHLYLWATTRHLVAAHEVAAAWKFHVSAVLVWCKKPRGFNVGGTWPSNVEFVLYGRRGSPPATGRALSRWYEWPRGAHSAKPDAFYDLVEQISPGPYLELFARRQRLGWDTWGDEALEHVEMGA